MKYIYSLLVILHLNVKLFSQDTSSVYKYYQLTNKAELAIVDNQPQKAAKFYKKAFSISNIKPFSTDLYNASINLIDINKYRIAKKYLIYMVANGLDLKYIENETAFVKIYSKKNWKKKIGKTNIIKKNKVLIDTLNLLEYRDQYFRKLPGSYKLYDDTIRKLDINNVSILKKLIDEKGYPSEKKIGYYEGFSFSKNFEIVIWHQTASYKKVDFTTILRNAVTKGEIQPKRAAHLIENQQSEDIYLITRFFTVSCPTCTHDFQKKIQDKFFYFSLSNETIHNINKLRYQIKLESLQDQEKKNYFSINNPESKFIFYPGYISKFSFQNETDALGFINNLKFIGR